MSDPADRLDEIRSIIDRAAAGDWDDYCELLTDLSIEIDQRLEEEDDHA